MIDRIHRAFRRSGAGNRRRPRPHAGEPAMITCRSDTPRTNTKRTSSSTSTARTRSRAGRGGGNGTSLARWTSSRDHVTVVSRTCTASQRVRARVKMLSNEIVFDIPRVVPEHVRPTHEVLLAWDHLVRRVRNISRAADDAPPATDACRRPVTARRVRFHIGSSLCLRGTMQ